MRAGKHLQDLARHRPTDSAPRARACMPLVQVLASLESIEGRGRRRRRLRCRASGRLRGQWCRSWLATRGGCGAGFGVWRRLCGGREHQLEPLRLIWRHFTIHGSVAAMLDQQRDAAVATRQRDGSPITAAARIAASTPHSEELSLRGSRSHLLSGHLLSGPRDVVGRVVGLRRWHSERDAKS